MKNTVSLSLHIPEPKTRPGDAVDFRDLEVPPAGALPRPDVRCSAEDTRALSYGLVRVLDETGGRWGRGTRASIPPC
ncbi:MAG: hypothetical protein WDM92_04455 [Caulobacteraceae bacterium]